MAEQTVAAAFRAAAVRAPDATFCKSADGGLTYAQAAGAIHTDFEKGFIKADVIAYDDFVAAGSEAAAKEAGKMRLEGKDYTVVDGDVMHFKFNN